MECTDIGWLSGINQAFNITSRVYCEAGHWLVVATQVRDPGFIFH